jgi:hypothetical protein
MWRQGSGSVSMINEPRAGDLRDSLGMSQGRIRDRGTCRGTGWRMGLRRRLGGLAGGGVE